jgi:hypothetical protein
MTELKTIIQQIHWGYECGHDLVWRHHRRVDEIMKSIWGG